MHKLTLPKRSELVNTSHEGEEDPLNHYYKPVIKYIYRKRLKLCLDLLQNKKFDKLLDIGYGSGIFFLTLKDISKELYGLDEHRLHEEVLISLQRLGIKANLVSADLTKMPFENEKFDAIISMSTYEHIKILDIAMKELNRILKKGGLIYIGVPVKNKITNIFLNMVGKHLPVDEMHPSSHKEIIKALSDKFEINKILTLPKFLPIDYSLYAVIEAVKV